ncbi:MAG TPA: hypothetical protein VGO53_13265, partial [Steroidobacteraceae bacterium]|nr:hypothetical protein [Steroidobacteraceae bacterium]
MRPVLRRALVALVILAIHWVGFRFLLIAPGLLPRDAEDPFVTTVYFLADQLREPAVQPDATHSPSRSNQSRKPARDIAKSQPVAPIGEALASETQTSEPQVSEAPRATDWALEAEAAARRQLANDEEARRLGSAFGHEFKDSTPDPNPAKDFAWSRAHTQRIEP